MGWKILGGVNEVTIEKRREVVKTTKRIIVIVGGYREIKERRFVCCFLPHEG